MFYDALEYADIHFEQKFANAELGLLMNSRNLNTAWEFYDRACKYMQKYGLEKYSVYVREMFEIYIFMHHCLTVALDCQEKLIWK